jgi:hypothetical protein
MRIYIEVFGINVVRRDDRRENERDRNRGTMRKNRLLMSKAMNPRPTEHGLREVISVVWSENRNQGTTFSE